MNRDSSEYRLGRMRHQVTIQRPTPRTDPDTGEALLEWQAITLEPIFAGRQRRTVEQEHARKPTRITTTVYWIRYRDDVDTTCRVVTSTGEVLEILSADDPDDRRRVLVIETRETK
ncbi:MAG: phage head closure protein [Planctomycetota bacterium]